jgi:hypothetical protein
MYYNNHTNMNMSTLPDETGEIAGANRRDTSSPHPRCYPRDRPPSSHPNSHAWWQRRILSIHNNQYIIGTISQVDDLRTKENVNAGTKKEIVTHPNQSNPIPGKGNRDRWMDTSM